MRGYSTSYASMFSDVGDEPLLIDRVEIPLIQRDYAQGRRTPRVNEIRSTFIEALHEALTGGEPIGLDFVYGEVNDGAFEPLDGQQRLTTLFLLHWYLASRLGQLDPAQPWTRFTYATRPSARLFCERIVENAPPADLTSLPSRWIKDQSWYLHLWRFDPTIQAMLVMIDGIATRFSGDDLDLVWQRLTDEADPAVRFQLLPIREMGSAEDLYIKMNSRGKPLTAFEEFKAHLGQAIEKTGRTQELGHKVDGPWADLLWPYRGDNDIVDDEFMNYLEFIFEICEWRLGRVRGIESIRPERRARTLFAEVENAAKNLDFFFDAFDNWTQPDLPDPKTAFDELFTTSTAGSGIRLFTGSDVNLLQAACDRYGVMRGTTRAFSLTDTLLLFALLVHRIEGTGDAPRRLRQLRNVNEASQFEMRVQNMPKFIAEVEAFMRSGDLDELKSFNQNQVTDERLKRDFLAAHPELEEAVHRLEDNSILRGTLAVFDLDATSLAGRVRAFQRAFAQNQWQALTGALLAVGEYQRDYERSDYHRFGSPTTESAWRAVLVDRGDRSALERTRTVLMSLLDTIGSSTLPIDEQLAAMVAQFISESQAASRFDWRYYLLRYPCMREGGSGIYYGADQKLGYQMTMLLKTSQNSWYRDPYLYAIWREAGRPSEVADPWFSGYSTNERWMRLERSRVGLRSVAAGVAMQPPAVEDLRATFESICQQHPDVAEEAGGWLLRIAQKPHDGGLVDSEDRVQKAGHLLGVLLSAGL